MLIYKGIEYSVDETGNFWFKPNQGMTERHGTVPEIEEKICKAAIEVILHHYQK